MKKKILVLVLFFVMVVAAMFTYSFTTKKDSTCPNHPGCVCPKGKTEQTAQAKVDCKDSCPNRPDCSQCSK